MAALFDDSLHIGTLTANDSPCNLELLLIVNLDVEPAGVFDALFDSELVRFLARLASF